MSWLDTSILLDTIWSFTSALLALEKINTRRRALRSALRLTLIWLGLFCGMTLR